MATATQTTTKPESPIPSWVKEEWQAAYLRVKGTAAAVWLWDRVFTAEDRRRLGNDLNAAYFRDGGAVGMWRFLRGESIPRAVVAVARRLGFLDADTGHALLRALGEEPDNSDDVVEFAVAVGTLVLVASPRQAFWDGEEIVIDWERHGKLWALLDELARTAKAGAALDSLALRERSGRDKDFLKKWKSRLVNAPDFPLSLADLVEVAGRGTYRLKLPPARIRIFENVGDAVREWIP